MPSQTSSELLRDPNEKMSRGIRGAKASEVFILVFPELPEALALPKMKLAKSLLTTMRAQTGSRTVIVALLLHIRPVRQDLKTLESTPLLVPQFLHAQMVGCSIDDPAVAVKSSRGPDGLR